MCECMCVRKGLTVRAMETAQLIISLVSVAQHANLQVPQREADTRCVPGVSTIEF
jgi:hypothetical protein